MRIPTIMTTPTHMATHMATQMATHMTTTATHMAKAGIGTRVTGMTMRHATSDAPSPLA